MAQLLEGLCLNLSNSLAGHTDFLADFRQCVLAAINAEPPTNDGRLFRG